MNIFKNLLVASILFGFVGLSSNVVANAEAVSNNEVQINTVSEPPVKFKNAENIDQVIKEINSYYLSQDDLQLRASPGTKWGEGTKVWDGEVGYYVTSYFWVKGSNMVASNIVGNAQRKAVTAKYDSVNKNTSYKMKTTQHITESASQTQGYITVSANAWCYSRD